MHYVNRMKCEMQLDQLTPTALPRKNREMHSQMKVCAKEAKTPNRAVRNRVALNAVVRPMRSEPGVIIRQGYSSDSTRTWQAYKFPTQPRRTSSPQTWMKTGSR